MIVAKLLANNRFSEDESFFLRVSKMCYLMQSKRPFLHNCIKTKYLSIMLVDCDCDCDYDEK